MDGTEEFRRCFVCDAIIIGQCKKMMSDVSSCTNTPFITKLQGFIGDQFVVVAGQTDCICNTCSSLFDEMEELESRFDEVHNKLTEHLMIKYPIMSSAEACLNVNTSHRKRKVANRLSSRLKDKEKKKESSSCMQIANVRSVKLLNASYFCKICRLHFVNTDSLIEHISKKHMTKDGRVRSKTLSGIEFLCGICCKKFSSEKLYQKHARIHAPKVNELKPNEKLCDSVQSKTQNVVVNTCITTARVEIKVTNVVPDSLETEKDKGVSELQDDSNLNIQSKEKENTDSDFNKSKENRDDLTKKSDSVSEQTKNEPIIESVNTIFEDVEMVEVNTCQQMSTNIQVVVNVTNDKNSTNTVSENAGNNIDGDNLNSVPVKPQVSTNDPKLENDIYCRHCNQFYASKKELLNHIKCDHIKEKVCTICDREFGLERAFLKHVEYMHRDDRICVFCQEPCESLQKLIEHERVHLKKEFKCEICEKVLKSQSGYNAHQIRQHTKQFPHVCGVCYRGFTSMATLNHHRSKHNDEPRYTCDVCGKEYWLYDTYHKHRALHDNPYPKECDICHEFFRSSTRLAVHKRQKHTFEKPFKCPHCPQSFHIGSLLKHHIYKHTNLYPFNCEICKKGFPTRNKYGLHLLKVHKDDSIIKKRIDKKIVKKQPKKEKSSDASSSE